MSRRITFRIPDDLKTQLDEAVRRDGYGGKGTSLWVQHALVQMCQEDPALVEVGLGEDLSSNDMTMGATLEDDILELLDKAVIEIRLQDPLSEGVQSAVIRAAIRYRLKHGRNSLSPSGHRGGPVAVTAAPQRRTAIDCLEKVNLKLNF